MLDEFIRLESVVTQMKREQKVAETEQVRKAAGGSMNLRTR